MTADALAKYYQLRAPQYDAIFQKPQQELDFKKLSVWLRREVNDRSVLEVACGTGYWTSVAASAAKLVVGIDINENMLQIARARMQATRQSLQFVCADAHTIPKLTYQFSCGMAHSWLSHVPRQHLPTFVHHFSQQLQPDSKLIFTDAKYVAGYARRPFSKRDSEGNTYQVRTLPGGSEFEIIKNFLSRDELLSLFAPLVGSNIQIEEWDYLWALKAKMI